MRSPALLLLCCASPLLLHAQPALEAVVEVKRFQSPDAGPLVVVNTSVLGGTAAWTADERGFRQAKVEALTMVEQNGAIVDFRKTMLFSPERADTLTGDFMHQERFNLKPGAYSLSMELHDANSPDTARLYVLKPIVVPEPATTAQLSDIQFTRPGDHGQEAQPFPGTWFPQEAGVLSFYAEAYGTPARFGQDGSFLAVAEIRGYEDGQVATNLRQVQRLKAGAVVPLGMAFPIDKLPSGNYVLALELHDRNDSTVARREQFFQRLNPVAYDPSKLKPGELGPNFTDAYTDPDTLAEHLASLRPIADELERKMIDDRWKDKQQDLMRDFLYIFWYNRSPADPEGAWKRYQQAVDYANRMFGCRNMRGYQSDQGVTYLKYGAPNSVVDRANETGVTPYMIWHYYKAGRYSDRRFVFVQPERSTTCWTMLTSDMPGELNNVNWLDEIAPGDADGGVKREEVMNNYRYPR